MRSRRRRLARQRKAQEFYLLTQRLLNDEWDDDFYYDDQRNCHYCGGEGYGIVGLDWDCDDPINGPYDGEIEECPCCNGSGKADDCCFW